MLQIDPLIMDRRDIAPKAQSLHLPNQHETAERDWQPTQGDNGGHRHQEKQKGQKKKKPILARKPAPEPSF
jgi:hypothetical protein